MKKIYVFMLMLLLVGQTILGPIATVRASDGGQDLGIFSDTAEVSADTESGENPGEIGDEPVTDSGTNNNPNSNVPDDGGAEEEPADTETTDPKEQEEENTEPIDSETTEPAEQGTEEGAENGDLCSETEQEAQEESECENAVNQINSIVVGDFDSVVEENVIHTVKYDPDGLKDSDYRPQLGEKVALEIRFTLPHGHTYGNGSILTYTLPSPLKAASGTGVLLNEDHLQYATYSVSNGQVIVTFNENIRFQGEGGSGGLETDGYFRIEAEYESSSNDLEQELILPNEGSTETIIINFQPLDGTKVKKSVKADNEGTNSQFVEWTVDVNTVMDDLGDEGIPFTDTLTGKHKYDPSSFIIERKQIGADGTVIKTEDVTDNFSTVGAEENSFTFQLTGKYAYTISYKTIPDESDEAQETLGNTGSFNGANSPQSTTIKYGSPLTKSVKKDGETAEWTIKVNENRRPLQAGTTITDTWGTNENKHEFVGEISVIGLNSDDYEFVSKDKGFQLKLKNDVSNEFTITYKTKPKDLVTERATITNEVVRSDRPSDIKEAKASYSQNVISKSNSNINYQKKTIDWRLELNNAKYTMENVKLSDIFENENLKIQGDIIEKINVDLGNNTNVTYNITAKDDKHGNEGKGGFDIEFTGTITAPIIITYTTEYDVRGVDNLDTYKNIGQLSWKTGEKSYSSETSSTVTINDQQKEKGYKAGRYNYETKRFEWSVGINYNFDEISNAKFSDTLPPSQLVDRDSIKVNKLDLATGGDGNVVGEPLVEGKDYSLTFENHTFTIVFASTINEAFRIDYQSRNKDDYYRPDGEKEVVENNARLTGSYPKGEYTANWSKKVTVEHTEKLISKHAKQEHSSGAKLNWTINLNWGQSTLKNAVISDTIGNDEDGNPNQIVYKESFQVCEMDYNGYNPSPELGTCYAPGNGLYDVFFENLQDPTATFEIKFNQKITKAYVVKYDTYFLGASNTQVENKAVLSYESSDSEGVKQDEQNYSAVFKFSGGANAKKGQLEITKVDTDNKGVKLPGAIFELWSAQENGFLIERLSESVDGVYTFKTKVGQGDYYLIETKSPDGYTAVGSGYDSRKKVTIKDTTGEVKNYVEMIEITNKKVKQAVKLIKVDRENPDTKLAGAEFTLHQENGDLVTDEVFKTNDQGEIVVNNLPAGKYYFMETKAPEHYLLENEEDERKTEIFEIKENQIEFTEVTKHNMRGKGKLVITKVDAADSTVLSGVVFELYNSAEELVGEQTTDDKGQIIFNELPYDTYTLIETAAKPDYVIENAEHTIVVKDDQQNGIEISKTITNKRITHSVKLTKYNSNKTLLLPNAVFELRKMNEGLPSGYEVVTTMASEKLVTDANGEIYLDELEPGEYQFVETKAPAGYYVNKTPVSFTITAKQTETVYVEKTNTRIPDPVGPTEPGVPVDPDRPEKPSEPDTPGGGNPSNPGTPGGKDPNQPGTPGGEDPSNPSNPDGEDPNNPSNPGGEDPIDPSQPGGENPNEPGGENPDDSNQSGGAKPSKPNNPDGSGSDGITTDTPKPNGNGTVSGSTNGKGNNKGTAAGGKLPQTGEETLLYMTILGSVLLLIGGGLLVRRRKTNE